MPSEDHKLLMKKLDKLVLQERWRKMPKSSGVVEKKSLTKSGNIRINVRTTKSGKTFYILARNGNLFAEGSKVMVGEKIHVALRRYLGRYYCVRLVRKGTEKQAVLSPKN